jgi:hypothetical protein
MGFFSRLFSKQPPSLVNSNVPFPGLVDNEQMFKMKIAAAGESVKAMRFQLGDASLASISREPFVIGYFSSLVLSHIDAVGLTATSEVIAFVIGAAADNLLGSQEAARAFAQYATTIPRGDKAMKAGGKAAAQDVAMWQGSQGILDHTGLMHWRVRRK